MHVVARLKSVLELLGVVFNPENKKPADDVFIEYTRKNRFIGSKDRKFIADYFFNILRYHEGLKKALDRNYSLLNALLLYFIHKNPQSKDVFVEHKYGLKIPDDLILRRIQQKVSMFAKNKCAIPEWMHQHFSFFGDTAQKQIDVLHNEATFDIRINPLLADREKVISENFSNINATLAKISPVGIRLHERIPLQSLDIWKKGHIEIQDEGAQIAAFLCDVKSGDNVLDYCAGAGGKTLLLSALMKNKGKVIATDLNAWRLDRAKKRLNRAQAHNVQIKPLEDKKWWKRHENKFDKVLIDVPCSGSGTWRRNPDLKNNFSQKDLEEVLLVQKEILLTAKKYIKPGGFLIYTTCSLWAAENHQQIEAFLSENKRFSLMNIDAISQKYSMVITRKHVSENDISRKTLQLTPYEHSVDGFYIAVLKKEENEKKS